LRAERALRHKSERDTNNLRDILIETAVRLDGTRLERIRRDDPSVPDVWSVEQWRAFMRDIPAVEDGWGVKAKPKKKDPELQKRIATLERQLEDLQREITAQRERADSLSASMIAGKEADTGNFVPSPVEFVHPVEGAAPPLSVIVADAKRQASTCPRKIPALAKVLDSGARTGGDLERSVQRAWLALYVVGRWELSASLEIDEVLSGVTGVSAGSGSLRRILTDLADAELLTSEALALTNPKTSLRVVRLTGKGAELYRQTFGREAGEGEWSRLIRLHEGETQREHTLAVLSFAMHARKRGYAARVLPDVEGNAAPDVWIGRDNEKLYAEVELGTKERVAKWRNQAALNNGTVALCASVERARQRLVGDCKLDKIASGVATDMETLIKTKYKEIGEATPLWVERW
jgi:hypothetical protein